MRTEALPSHESVVQMILVHHAALRKLDDASREAKEQQYWNRVRRTYEMNESGHLLRPSPR